MRGDRLTDLRIATGPIVLAESEQGERQRVTLFHRGNRRGSNLLDPIGWTR